MKKELAAHWNLAVTVLRGDTKQTYDYFSNPDLYVTLRLPTACACTLKTKMINDTQTPEWNETFHFCVYSQLKNILEINLYDGDLVRDEQGARILFDITTLTLGRKETKVFIVDDEKQDKLWVEFHLTESAEAPAQFLSNGVLLAAPMTTVEVKLDKASSDSLGDKDLLLNFLGAHCEKQVIPLSEDSSSKQTLRYHINKHLETKIQLQKEDESLNETPVRPLRFENQFTVPIPVEEDVINLRLNTVDRSAEDMKVRLDFDIPPEEKEFLLKRKAVVSEALQKILNLETPLSETQVPTVALVCSGGGTRAMTGMFGFVKGLRNLGLLDVISYITSLSGSTWSLASLYSDPTWSKEGLDEIIAFSQKELSKSTASLVSPKQLHSYHSELKKREEEGHMISIVDSMGLIIENLIFGKKHPGKLSDQRKAVSEGQNPLPIYTAVNIKKDACGCVVPEWCEFTPYEVGFPKYGAFVPVEHFGSEFYLGHVMKEIPETRITFFLGVFANNFSANLSQLWSAFTGSMPPWASRFGGRVDRIETDTKPTTLDTMRIMPEASRMNNLVNDTPFISSFFNFLRGFFLHNTYREQPEFNTCNDTHPDAFPNTLTPADPVLDMVDAGLATKTPFTPVLWSHRRADVILCMDYSWAEDLLLSVKQTQKYCNEHKLPFPKIDFAKYESQPIKEVYVFEDESNPDAPIVVFFPRINSSFRHFKAPGVKRQGKKERQEGNIDISSESSPYTTKNLMLSPEDFQKLVDLTLYNVTNSAAHTTYALKKALNKKGLGLPNVTMPSEDSSSFRVAATRKEVGDHRLLQTLRRHLCGCAGKGGK